MNPGRFMKLVNLMNLPGRHQAQRPYPYGGAMTQDKITNSTEIKI